MDGVQLGLPDYPESQLIGEHADLIRVGVEVSSDMYMTVRSGY